MINIKVIYEGFSDFNFLINQVGFLQTFRTVVF